LNITRKTYAEFVNADGSIKKDVKPLWNGYGHRLSPALAGKFSSVDETTHTFENATKYYLYVMSPDKEPKRKSVKFLINGKEVDKATYYTTRDTWITPSELTKIAQRSADQKAGIRAPMAIGLDHVKVVKRGNIKIVL